MTDRQHDRARRFAELHRGPAFVIANAWDAGSARLLEGLGFPAIATSSGAMAGTLGRRDGQVGPDEAIAHVRAIAAAVDLPVSGDLEKGFGDSPEAAADTVRRAAQAGLVGCSIEDATGEAADPLFPFDRAVARVRAAALAARSLDFPFTLTARAEGLLHGEPGLDEIVRRLQAFESAGADVLFAPGLPTLEAVRSVCAAVTAPVNFMAGIPGKSFTVAELAAAGVRRISLATSLYRAAMTGLVEAAREVREHGTFGYLDRSLATRALLELMRA